MESGQWMISDFIRLRGAMIGDPQFPRGEQLAKG
jgi:hypothetical protein